MAEQERKTEWGCHGAGPHSEEVAVLRAQIADLVARLKAAEARPAGAPQRRWYDTFQAVPGVAQFTPRLRLLDAPPERRFESDPNSYAGFVPGASH
jgi:hypothetical protein